MQDNVALATTEEEYLGKRLLIYERIGEMCGSYWKFFEIKFEQVLTFKLKEDRIRLANLMDGRYAILTNTSLPPAEVLKLTGESAETRSIVAVIDR